MNAHRRDAILSWRPRGGKQKLCAELGSSECTKLTTCSHQGAHQLKSEATTAQQVGRHCSRTLKSPPPPPMCSGSFDDADQLPDKITGNIPDCACTLSFTGQLQLELGVTFCCRIQKSLFLRASPHAFAVSTVGMPMLDTHAYLHNLVFWD